MDNNRVPTVGTEEEEEGTRRSTGAAESLANIMGMGAPAPPSLPFTYEMQQRPPLPFLIRADGNGNSSPTSSSFAGPSRNYRVPQLPTRQLTEEERCQRDSYHEMIDLVELRAQLRDKTNSLLSELAQLTDVPIPTIRPVRELSEWPSYRPRQLHLMALQAPQYLGNNGLLRPMDTGKVSTATMTSLSREEAMKVPAASVTAEVITADNAVMTTNAGQAEIVEEIDNEATMAPKEHEETPRTRRDIDVKQKKAEINHLLGLAAHEIDSQANVTSTDSSPAVNETNETVNIRDEDPDPEQSEDVKPDIRDLLYEPNSHKKMAAPTSTRMKTNIKKEITTPAPSRESTPIPNAEPEQEQEPEPVSQLEQQSAEQVQVVQTPPAARAVHNRLNNTMAATPTAAPKRKTSSAAVKKTNARKRKQSSDSDGSNYIAPPTPTTSAGTSTTLFSPVRRKAALVARQNIYNCFSSTGERSLTLSQSYDVSVTSLRKASGRGRGRPPKGG